MPRKATSLLLANLKKVTLPRLQPYLGRKRRWESGRGKKGNMTGGDKK